MKNVVLVGFPGCGKTTVGNQLASQLNLNFVDLDAAVEEKYHTTVPQLFQKYGELVFRKCEYQTLNELLQKEQLLIATGGGAPCYEDAMSLINQHALSVYLNLSEETLVQRLRNSHKVRPLVQNLTLPELQQYVHDTLCKRCSYYEQAQLILTEEALSDLSALKAYFNPYL